MLLCLQVFQYASLFNLQSAEGEGWVTVQGERIHHHVASHPGRCCPHERYFYSFLVHLLTWDEFVICFLGVKILLDKKMVHEVRQHRNTFQVQIKRTERSAWRNVEHPKDLKRHELLVSLTSFVFFVFN